MSIDPTPHYDFPDDDLVIPPENFSKNSKKAVNASDKVMDDLKEVKEIKRHPLKSKRVFTPPKPGNENPNFPLKGPRKRKNLIVPAHRVVMQQYKEQGFRNAAKAIRKTGIYSETMAKRSTVITKSKSWQLLLQEYMPEEHLAERHQELLNKREWRKVKNNDGTYTEVDNGPDTPAVKAGLDMAYKLRGSFKKDEAPPPSTVMYNLFYKQDVRDQMKTFEDGLKKTLRHEMEKKDVADLEQAAKNEEAKQGAEQHDRGAEAGETTDSGGTEEVAEEYRSDD